MTNTIAIFVNITRGEKKLGALIQQFLSGFCLEDWQRLLAAWGWWTEPRDRVVATCELLKWAEQQPACQWWSERWRRLQLESNQDEGLPCVWEELKQIYLKCLLKAKSKKKKKAPLRDLSVAIIWRSETHTFERHKDPLQIESRGGMCNLGCDAFKAAAVWAGIVSLRGLTRAFCNVVKPISHSFRVWCVWPSRPDVHTHSSKFIEMAA